MQSPTPKIDDKVTEKNGPPGPRDRLRDIIVVIVIYPLTPTERTEELVKKKPWLEIVSLILKIGLTGMALVKLLLE